MPSPYLDAEDDSSSLVAFACASFVLQDGDLDSPYPPGPSSPQSLAPAPHFSAANKPAQQQQQAEVAAEDSVQALIRKVEQESLSSATNRERRRDTHRRRRADLPPRFRPATPSQHLASSPTSPAADANRAAQRSPFTPTSPESPRGDASAYGPAGGRRPFASQIDVTKANRLSSALPFGRSVATPAATAAQSAPPTRLSFSAWPTTPSVLPPVSTERSQSPPFSDCSTISSSSSSTLHSPFEPRHTAISGYPFPASSSPRKLSADDWVDPPKTLPSLEMIQQRMARGRAEGLESPTRSTFGAAGSRQGLPSFLLARKQQQQQQPLHGTASSPWSSSSSTGTFATRASFGVAGLRTPPM